MTREEIERAIAVLDAHCMGTKALPAWMALRGELRARRRQSERMIPAVSVAVQHATAARESAERVVEILGAIPNPPPHEDDGKK